MMIDCIPVYLASGGGPEEVFRTLSVVLLAALAVSLIFQRLKQSLLIGYFVCGVLVGPDLLGGPGALGIFEDPGDRSSIEAMADVGVVLLMFSIGIEFSISHLRSLRRIALVGAPIQIFGTAIVVAIICLAFGMPIPLAVLTSVIVAISSTAIVLKVFQDTGGGIDLATRIAVGVAIVQDIFVVGFIIILPNLFPSEEGSSFIIELLKAFGMGIAFLAICWLLSRFIIPPILRWVSQTKSRELFTLTVISLCVGIAEMSYLFGLGFSLGAFVAGLLVSETVYSHKIMADVLPFKDLFLTIFFVSVGMLMELDFFLSHWPVLLLCAGAIVLIKAAIAFWSGIASKNPVRSSVMAALGLGCIGEFSFVLLREADGMGAFPADSQFADLPQFLAIVAVLTMSITPVLVKFTAPISRLIERLPLFKPNRKGPPEQSSAERIKEMRDHAIICGYGPIGQALTDSLNHFGIPTLVIELNAKTVDRLMEEGQPVLFADASQSLSLQLAHLERARLLAITFPGGELAEAVIKQARAMMSDILILSRARFPSDVERLQQLGIQMIIHEEQAASDAVIRHALPVFDLDEEQVDEMLDRLHYESGTGVTSKLG